MKVKTADLIDLHLDWAVAECLGATRIQLYEYSGRRMIRVSLPDGIHAPWEPSRYWGQGGPLLEHIKGFTLKHWLESEPETCCEAHIHNHEGNWVQFGPTPLIAAMRCFVASQLGDEVEVPDELMK